jgi:hypothetical protein
MFTWRLIGPIGCLVLASACAAPISVTRLDSQTAQRELTRNILYAGEPSRFSPRGYDLGPADRIPWAIEAQSNGGTAWLVTSRYLARAPQPWLEVQTMMAAEAQIRDASRPSVAATFSSTYVAPWLRWMQMGDAPGHLLWHASGRKLASWAELPEAYEGRAQRLKPEHFIRP